MASEMSANNPDFIESLRRNMGNRSQSNNPPSSLSKEKEFPFTKFSSFRSK